MFNGEIPKESSFKLGKGRMRFLTTAAQSCCECPGQHTRARDRNEADCAKANTKFLPMTLCSLGKQGNQRIVLEHKILINWLNIYIKISNQMENIMTEVFTSANFIIKTLTKLMN